MAVFFLIHVLFGENAVIAPVRNMVIKFTELPVLHILNGWFSISGLLEYLFWYSLGAFACTYLYQYANLRRTKPMYFHLCGMLALGVSSILFLKKVTKFEKISKWIYSSLLIFKPYKALAAICICFGVIYLSMLLENSSFLKEDLLIKVK